jgi:N-acetylmuramoyl-L-alanine amidase
MDDASDTEVVARTLFGEARGEGKQGMVAVACVIYNRAVIAGDYEDDHGMPHPLYGDGSLASACKAPLQFSCWNAGDPNRALIERVTESEPIFLVAVGIGTDAENDQLDDITNGATHYCDKRMPLPPAWAKGKTPCFALGNHLFFNNIDG